MDRTGQVLNGRYHIVRVLGRGGMGCVYLARQQDLDAWVAIKEMEVSSIEPELRAASMQQFRAEARILNRLHHANLPRVYDFFEVGESQFLVMDYIEGQTLHQLICTSIVSETQVLEWARALCDVLSYLHGHQPPVIFKDLKPSNIMLARDGTVRLIDFGIAKIFDPALGMNTQTVLKGSVSDGFSPIEQYGQASTDVRSDVYALGATLYCLLTRLVPPPAPDRVGGDDPLDPLGAERPDVSENTRDAIEWMMQVHREARPASMTDVAEALGFTGDPGVMSVPTGIRRLLAEEFHHFFPSPTWLPRESVPLERLVGFLTQEGTPASLVGLWGAPGSGKSRLVDELKTLCGDHFREIPTMRASAMYRMQPFGCLLPAFRRLLRQDPDLITAAAETLEGQVVKDASVALPEMKAAVSGKHSDARTAADYTRSLVNTLMAILEQAVRDGPVLLVLDDAQWADAVTMHFLNQVRESSLGRHVAMVLAWQPDWQDEPHRKFVEAWNRENEAMLVELAPFTPDEVAAYVTGFLPPIAGLETCLPELHARSGGNPLLLEELVRLMVIRRLLVVSYGVLRVDGWNPAHLPGDLKEAVRRRLEHFPVDCQTLLSQASVIGPAFTVQALMELTGESEATLREMLQRSREAMFVRVSPDEVGLFEFQSDDTRQVFYDRLSRVDRARLHRTIGLMEEDRAVATGEVSLRDLHFHMAGELDETLENLSHVAQEFLSPRNLQLVLQDMPQVKTWDASSLLSPEQEAWAVKAVHMLMRGVRSKGAYGGSTHVTEMAQESMLSIVLPLLTAVGPVTVSLSETHFTINNRDVPVAQAPGDLLPLLQRLKLSGFQLRPGLTKAELIAFVGLLIRTRESIMDAGGWSRVLAKEAITHITVSEMIFVGVAETELFDPARLKDYGTLTMKDARSLNGPDGSLDSIADMLETLSEERDEQAVLSRLEVIRQLLEDLRSKSAGPVVVPAEPAPVAMPQPALPDHVAALVKELRTVKPEEAARLLTFVRRVATPLDELVKRSPTVLLQSIEPLEDPDQEAAVAEALIRIGVVGVPELVRYLGRSDNERVRACALFALRRIVTDAEVLLTRRVMESPSAEESCRLLEVMASAKLPWQRALNALLNSPIAQVRRQAFQFLQQAERMSQDEKAMLLDEIMRSDYAGPVSDALRAAGMLRLQSMTATLLGMLRRTFETAADTVLVQKEACYALGRIADPATLPVLRSVVYPSLAQVVTMKRDAEVRAAALWAIGRIPGRDADEILQRAASERDALFRSVADVAIEARSKWTTDPEVLAQLE